MKIGSLKPSNGAVKKRKRVGIGSASGHGKTCGRGSKGQKSRSGGGTRPGFEGGQMPLARRVPKRGFKNIFAKKFEIVNIEDLAIFDANSEIGTEILVEKGIVRKGYLVKILGRGKIDKPLTVKADSFSSKAKEAIESAGGKAVRIRLC